MSNPYTRGSLSNFPDGPSGGGSYDGITSLAAGQALGLGSITTSPLPAADIVIAPIGIQSGASGVNGTASIYLLVSEDGTTWTGGINPATSTNQATTLATLLASDTAFGPVQTINMTANATTYYFREFAVSSIVGPNIPSYVSILVQNQSGASFGSTAGNHYAKYRIDTYT